MAVGSTIGGAGFNSRMSQIIDSQPGEAEPYRESYAMHAMANMPKWYQTLGATAFRGSNTIVSGGWADRANRARTPIGRFFGRGEDIGVGGAIKNNNITRPRVWSRYGSQDAFFPGEGHKSYSPFAQGSDAVNFAARHGALGNTARRWVGEDAAATGGKGKLVGKGMFSQISAAERLGRMENISGETAHWAGQYLGRAEAAGGAARAGSFDISTPGAARTAIYRAMPYKAGQYIGGYANALRGGAAPNAADLLSGDISHQFFSGGMRASGALRAGGITAEQAAGKIGFEGGANAIKAAFATGEKRFLAGGAERVAGSLGAKVAGGAVAGETALALGARGALAAIPFVNAAMLAWTAYDITRALVPGSARMATDAFKSYTGWGSRQMFARNTFRINDATLTSRSRGVMAIQNSRLNARSILGSEAGGMAAYFG